MAASHGLMTLVILCALLASPPLFGLILAAMPLSPHPNLRHKREGVSIFTSPCGEVARRTGEEILAAMPLSLIPTFSPREKESAS